MPNKRAKRTGTSWLLSALAVGLVAGGCGKEAGGGGSGGAGGSINPARNDAGNRGGAGGSSTGSGGSSSTGSGGSTGGSGISPVPGGSSGSGAGGSGSTGDGGSATSYDPPAGQAVAKFCNELAGPMNMILEFQLEVGAEPVRLVARSGECFPPAPQRCASIPVGPVTLKVIDTADQMLVLETEGMIPDASQMLFLATIDEMTQRPVFRGGRIPPENNCAAITFDTGMPPMPDGGAGPVRPPLMP